jgi:hypothetical protein
VQPFTCSTDAKGLSVSCDRSISLWERDASSRRKGSVAGALETAYI